MARPAFVKLKYTDKNIFVQDHYISITKAMLSLPIFNMQRRNAEFMEIEIGRIAQYSDITIKTYLLNLDIDFNVFLYLLIEANTKQVNKFHFNIDDLFAFMRVSTKNKILYTPKIVNALEKIRALTMAFTVNGSRYICGLINSARYDIETKKITVELSQDYRNLYIADSNAIYNLRRDAYNELKGDYEKALYLLYMSNSANKLNFFPVELLKARLQCENLEDKKFIYNVRKANKILKDAGLINDYFEKKKNRKTVVFCVDFNSGRIFKNLEYKKTETSKVEFEGKNGEKPSDEITNANDKIDYGYKRPAEEIAEEQDDNIPF